MTIGSRLLSFCKNCGDYTMLEKCSRCDSRTVDPAPPRFSPEDRYGEYRRRMKKESRMEE